MGRAHIAISLATVAFAGCTNAGATIRIVRNQLAGSGCVVSSDQTGDYQTRGIVDARSSLGYFFTPLVENLAQPNTANPTAHSAVVTGADVSLSFQNGLFSASELSQLAGSVTTHPQFSGTVAAGDSAGFSFVAIPVQVLQAIKPKLASDGSQKTPVQLTARIVGTIDGSSTQSDDFNYTVDVCNGCLANVVSDCNNLPSGLKPAPGGGCNPLQDSSVDCCSRTDGSLMCPAPTPSM